MGAPTADDPRRCVATKSSGDPCGRWAILGGKVCPAHGGSVKRVRAAAERRLAEEKLRRELERVDVEPLGDPHEALEMLAGDCLRWHKLMRHQVDELVALRYTSERTGAEQLRSEVVLYERACDRLLRILDAIARLGLEERRVRIAEAQAAYFALVMDAVFDDLGYSDYSEHLRVLMRHRFGQVPMEVDADEYGELIDARSLRVALAAPLPAEVVGQLRALTERRPWVPPVPLWAPERLDEEERRGDVGG